MPDEAFSPKIVLLLLAVATAVAIATRRLRLPYTVALVLSGIVLGLTHLFNAPHLTHDLVFTVFLPGLVFEAAYHLRFDEVRRDWMAIIALAVPGVALGLAVTAALVVGTAHLLGVPPLVWTSAFAFGALVAATDPIAVVALFRTLGAPARLTVLIEAESLLNDGTAIVFLAMILAIASGDALSVPALALFFVRVVAIGAVAGSVVALAIGLVSRRIDDPMIEFSLTVLAAYGSFALAEALGGSGVIATVAAGLLTGNHLARSGMTTSSRATVESFWEYVAFLLNSAVFLMIGLEVSLGALAEQWRLIVAAALAVLAARVIVMATVYGLVVRSQASIPAKWIGVMTWGGLRGALSMVLALSLPDTLPGRSTIITVTFGVVLLSIVVQGSTMSPLLRWLGIGCHPAAVSQTSMVD
ncbi:MAG TPA: sodium:proton antiporter [Gemmatimonadales bacterium]